MFPSECKLRSKQILYFVFSMHHSFACKVLKGVLFIDQAPVVQRLGNAIHRINHYPVDSVVCFVNTYPLDSDLSAG